MLLTTTSSNAKISLPIEDSGGPKALSATKDSPSNEEFDFQVPMDEGGFVDAAYDAS